MLLTGHTGFKGSWMALWLQRMGAKVTGVALPPSTAPSLFTLLGDQPGLKSCLCDIRDEKVMHELVLAARPEVVFHLAAQALVRASYHCPEETFSTNVMGTVNLLEAVRHVPDVKVVVAVTTDKVYKNLEWCYPYREDDPLGGHDPYSASKAAAEMVVASYRSSFLKGAGIALASARAGNVIGGGDWSVDRLIPDAIRAWQAQRPLSVRNPQATRPWQHVLEPLAGYMTLAERLWLEPDLADAYNFGPAPQEAATVDTVLKSASGRGTYCEFRYEKSVNSVHEANWLALETSKSCQTLGWHPRWDLNESVSRTFAWYRSQHAGQSARTLCNSDIDAYEAVA